LELSAISLAFNSHRVISPSAGGGGKTDNEDIRLAAEYFSCARSNLPQLKDGGKVLLYCQAFQTDGKDWKQWSLFWRVMRRGNKREIRENIFMFG